MELSFKTKNGKFELEDLCTLYALDMASTWFDDSIPGLIHPRTIIGGAERRFELMRYETVVRIESDCRKGFNGTITAMDESGFIRQKAILKTKAKGQIFNLGKAEELRDLVLALTIYNDLGRYRNARSMNVSRLPEISEIILLSTKFHHSVTARVDLNEDGIYAISLYSDSELNMWWRIRDDN